MNHAQVREQASSVLSMEYLKKTDFSKVTFKLEITWKSTHKLGSSKYTFVPHKYTNNSETIFDLKISWTMFFCNPKSIQKNDGSMRPHRMVEETMNQQYRNPRFTIER